MRISAFTRIFVLGVAAFLVLAQPSFGRGGGHRGGGHRGRGHFGGGFHGGRLPTASRAGSGAYTNVLTGEKEPVAGQIDKATQRVAFHLGKNTDSVVEAGAYNLTQDVASCKVYFGRAKPQTWLLVRLPAPKVPEAPTPLALTSTPASTGNAAAAANTKLTN